MEEILPVFWFGFVNLATSVVVAVCFSGAVWVIIVFRGSRLSNIGAMLVSFYPSFF